MSRWATRILGHNGVQFVIVLVLGLSLFFGWVLSSR